MNRLKLPLASSELADLTGFWLRLLDLDEFFNARSLPHLHDRRIVFREELGEEDIFLADGLIFASGEPAFALGQRFFPSVRTQTQAVQLAGRLLRVAPHFDRLV